VISIVAVRNFNFRAVRKSDIHKGILTPRNGFKKAPRYMENYKKVRFKISPFSWNFFLFTVFAPKNRDFRQIFMLCFLLAAACST
jgi:hypothetical protein